MGALPDHLAKWRDALVFDYESTGVGCCSGTCVTLSPFASSIRLPPARHPAFVAA